MTQETKNDLTTASLHQYISSPEDIIEEARAGRMFILVDDEDRENEGDLVIPAQFATAEQINFMARFARGLICLAMTSQRVEKLNLPLMAQANGTRHQTAFTVSIEAREGVTTGISAHDRARTVAVAINPEATPADITTPGHVFPLMARDGGALIRAGHTEAAVDISRLAGLNPSGVICEIMNDDGTMARMPDLVAFAQRHNLKLGTIADLISYRRRTEKLVQRVEDGVLHHAVGGEWKLAVYTNSINESEDLALIKGDISDGKPVTVRMHALDVFNDVLAPPKTYLHNAMQMIADEGRGVVVLLRGMSMPMRERVRHIDNSRQSPRVLRDYGIGAQILLDLGIHEVKLLTTTGVRTIVGAEGYDLRVIDQVRIGGTHTE